MDVDRVANNIKFQKLSQENRGIYLLGEFQKVIDRINLEYLKGTLDFISRNRKDLYQNYQ